jgi:hypothetical protein
MPVSGRLPDRELMQLLALGEPKVIISRTLIAPILLNPADSGGCESISPNQPVLISNPIKTLASRGSTGKPKLVITTGEALLHADKPIVPVLMRFKPDS